MMMIQRTILFSLLLVAVTQGDDSPNFRRGLGKPVPDPSACNDPSAVLYPPGDTCDFPVIVAGFGVSGLPAGATEAMGRNEIYGGTTANTGFYKVGDDFSCDSVESSYIVKGTGSRLEISQLSGDDNDDNRILKMTGNFVIVRPAGLTSYATEFPDQQGGIWQASGSVTFDGNTLVRYRGTAPYDICQYLADESE
jgi:hypothetical protein